MSKKFFFLFTRWLRITFSLGLLLLAIFLPAGTFYWVEAWVLIGIYLLGVGGLLLWLRKYDPELLKERATRKNDGKLWDKILLSFYTFFLLLMLITCGLDAVRYGWSVVPLALRIIMFTAFIPVVLLFFLVYRENTFASGVVRIQQDRAQRVIKSGPYRFVRHPMYSGIILMVLLVPPALGSWWGLVFSGLIVVIFIIRTYLEDHTLQRELPGYQEYTAEVKFRLFPGIW